MAEHSKEVRLIFALIVEMNVEDEVFQMLLKKALEENKAA